MVIAGVILSIIERILGLRGMIIGIYGPLTCLLLLATIVPSLAVGARRLHDTNRSGWLQLIAWVPYAILLAIRPATGSAFGALALAGMVSIIAFICAIIVLIFMVLPGAPGDNSYGPNPYGAGTGGTVAAG